jgi:hypothetical protein
MIAVVLFELLVCSFLAVLITVGNADDSGQGGFFLQVWFACATLQLAIHYLPRLRYHQYIILIFLILLLTIGITSGRFEIFTYFHQALIIAALASLPQLWWEWSSKARGGRTLVLFFIGMVALPLGFSVWTLANIGIVKTQAWVASRGEANRIFVSTGNLFSGGYRQIQDIWSLSGWNMVSARGLGGSGHCCQWDFHALLITRDNRIFNWSYRSQRFERISDQEEAINLLWKLK